MTQIIATLGPVSNSSEKIQALYNAGVSVFRLNFSHGSHQWHKEVIEKIRSIAPNSLIMLDTKGPEMRTGDLKSNMSIVEGQMITLTIDPLEQDEKKSIIFVNHPGIVNDVVAGDLLSLDSGLIELEVLSVSDESVRVKALHSGDITSRRHLNLVGKDVSLPTITERDREDIIFGLENGIDMIALSFVRTSEAMSITKALIKEHGNKKVKVFAKIESQAGIDNLADIASHADGLMVARGDLGVETPLEYVPQKRKDIISAAKKNNIPVIVATEMLQSMVEHPRPTRAEVSDIALAVWQGADYTMLSGETASGKYPVESVEIMKRVIEASSKTQ